MLLLLEQVCKVLYGKVTQKTEHKLDKVKMECVVKSRGGVKLSDEVKLRGGDNLRGGVHLSGRVKLEVLVSLSAFFPAFCKYFHIHSSVYCLVLSLLIVLAAFDPSMHPSTLST